MLNARRFWLLFIISAFFLRKFLFLFSSIFLTLTILNINNIVDAPWVINLIVFKKFKFGANNFFLFSSSLPHKYKQLIASKNKIGKT